MRSCRTNSADVKRNELRRFNPSNLYDSSIVRTPCRLVTVFPPRMENMRALPKMYSLEATQYLLPIDTLSRPASTR